MKTPTDTPFQDIRDVPSAGIGPLLRDPDPRVRHRGLVLLAESLAACPAPRLAPRPAPDGAAGSGSSDVPGRAELAALLPLSVTGPPESALLPAELVGCGDPGVRADAARFARQGLRAGLLVPALVRARLTDLARADDPATAATGTGTG
ncbi:hypothetical protein [Streptomyces sp. NPDC056987]|uniref:hypothetical protein n=1 Tax=Streptomyces sp. NPDC056987 TaxID=3345988 RepID=UPI00362DF48C